MKKIVAAELDLSILTTERLNNNINWQRIENSTKQNIHTNLSGIDAQMRANFSGMNANLHIDNLQNEVFKKNFLRQLNSSKIETKLTPKKDAGEMLPVKDQIEKLFLRHENYNPKHHIDKRSAITADMKVYFSKNAIRGPHFFNTTLPIVQAATQHASGLAPKIWFGILAYLCLTQGQYSISEESTRGYEVLMQLRIILDLYVQRSVPFKNSISVDELQHDIPEEARQAFDI